MWFSPVILSLALQALPPCELPNLDQPYGVAPSAFEVKTLADGNFGIAMVDPMGDNDERLPGTPEGPAPARPHSERSVWVWSEASGWLLAPKGLKVTAAGVGVDGSWVIEMSQAQSPGRLRASSSGSCVGCAYSSGAPYFDAYLQAARENEFQFCEGLAQPIVRDDASDNRLHFHFDSPSGARHDVVVLIGTEEVGFEELAVSGLDPKVTDELLNAFTVE